MKHWMQLLPFFLVERIARKKLERWCFLSGMVSIQVFDGLWLSWKEMPRRERNHD